MDVSNPLPSKRSMIPDASYVPSSPTPLSPFLSSDPSFTSSKLKKKSLEFHEILLYNDNRIKVLVL